MGLPRGISANPPSKAIPRGFIAIQTFGDFIKFNNFCHVLRSDGVLCEGSVGIGHGSARKNLLAQTPEDAPAKGQGNGVTAQGHPGIPAFRVQRQQRPRDPTR